MSGQNSYYIGKLSALLTAVRNLYERADPLVYGEEAFGAFMTAISSKRETGDLETKSVGEILDELDRGYKAREFPLADLITVNELFDDISRILSDFIERIESFREGSKLRARKHQFINSQKEFLTRLERLKHHLNRPSSEGYIKERFR